MKFKIFILLTSNLIAAEYAVFDKLQYRNGMYYEINSQTPYTGDVVGYFSMDDEDDWESIYQNLQLVVNSLSNYELINKNDFIDLYKNPDTNDIIKKQIVKIMKISEISSMKNGLYDGPYVDFHENGQIYQKFSLTEGKSDGFAEVFYSDGQIAKRRTWKDGKEDGLSQIFYPNGQIQFNYEMKEGINHGIFQEYYENGQLKEDLIMEEGEIQQIITFYENGQWEEKATYPGTIELFHKNGQLHMKASTDEKGIFGFVEVMDEKGNIIEKLTSPTGEIELFYPSGKTLFKTGIKDAQFHGPFSEYDGFGNKIQWGEYKNGKFHGELINCVNYCRTYCMIYLVDEMTYPEECSDRNHNSILIKKLERPAIVGIIDEFCRAGKWYKRCK